jgi:hypothetical protein
VNIFLYHASIKDSTGKGGECKMDFKTETVPEYRIAYVRQTGPYGPANQHVMEELKLWAKEKSLLDEAASYSEFLMIIRRQHQLKAAGMTPALSYPRNLKWTHH